MATGWSWLKIRGTLFKLHKKFSQGTICRHRARGQTHRPPGGGRPLLDQSKVFTFNNWDNVVWDEEQEAQAEEKVRANSQTRVVEEDQEKYEKEADRFWNEFYNIHQNRFFKDRHWLFTEFPELAPGGIPDHIAQKASDNCSAVGQALSEGIAQKQCFDVGVNDSSASSVTKLHMEIETDTQQETKCKTTEAEQTDVPVDENKETNVHLPKTQTDQSVQMQMSPVGSNQLLKKTEEFPGCNSTMRILEVGCGVGNTVFPVLQTNVDPGLFVYCCDLSSTAIKLVQEHADYREERCHAFVCDITDENSPFPFPENSLDMVVLIFVLSAVHPNKMQDAVNRLACHLKPGGLIVFRDYGRYDLAQLRFKPGRCLSENFYVRGDGTRVYFFTQDELREIFKKAGLEEEQNLIDRRLQVNRGRQLKMYRVWIQCKYRKSKNT